MRKPIEYASQTTPKKSTVYVQIRVIGRKLFYETEYESINRVQKENYKGNEDSDRSITRKQKTRLMYWYGFFCIGLLKTFNVLKTTQLSGWDVDRKTDPERSDVRWTY